MAAPTMTLDTNQPGPLPGPGGMIIEKIKVVGGGGGSAVGDTVSYVSSFIQDAKYVSPGYSIQSQSSNAARTQTNVIELQHAIGAADIEYIDLIGFA